ncbi:MAG: respiratory nitrate reductase subunit gamma [Armatimonadetes bacterium]|nr:respiratory nitrate reductase subunit gamma [Armatimonadota bacterium]
MPSLLDTFLFGVLPYLCLAVFVLGSIYRNVVRKLEWTAKSSEFFERAALGPAILCWHWGIITLFVAHLIGWTGGAMNSATLINVFHWLGMAGGVFALYGLLLALARRIVIPTVRAMSKPEDYILLVWFSVIIILALVQVLVQQKFGLSMVVAPWLTGVFLLNPDPAIMAGLTAISKIHITLAMLLAAYWPFTKLVHVFSYPFTYFWRPYQNIRAYQRMIR